LLIPKTSTVAHCIFNIKPSTSGIKKKYLKKKGNGADTRKLKWEEEWEARRKERKRKGKHSRRYSMGGTDNEELGRRERV